jgi:hypothetical protein
MIPFKTWKDKKAPQKRRERSFQKGKGAVLPRQKRPPVKEGAFETVHLFSIIASPSGDEALRSGRAALRHTRRPA